MENNKQNNNSDKDFIPKKDVSPVSGDALSVHEGGMGTIHPEDRIIITPLRTYADDVKRAIADDNVSVVKIAMAEAKKKEVETKEEEELDPRSSKNTTIIVVSFVMLVLGVVGFGGVWYFSQSTTPQTIVTTTHRDTIIPYDEEILIGVKNNERREIIEGLDKAKNAVYGNDTSLVFMPVVNQSGTTTTLVSAEAFLSLLNTRTPAQLVRAFDQRFMFGLDRGVDGFSPFILMKAESFNQAYAGMLGWESAMADDIGDIFFSKEELSSTSPAKIPVITATSTATTTEISTSTQQQRYILADSLSFKDEVINNKDVRALRTPSGHLLMYYAFISDKLVLIAKDFRTIDEVTQRLATSQFKQ